MVSDLIMGQMLSGVRVCRVLADTCVKPLQLLGSLSVQTFSRFVSSPVELPPTAQVSVAKTTDLAMHFSVRAQK